MQSTSSKPTPLQSTSPSTKWSTTSRPEAAALSDLAQAAAGWHPSGRRVDVGSESVYLVDRGGAGRPVVLLHGLLVSSWAWRHTLAGLDPQFRPIAVCLKGHGWSSKHAGDYSLSGLARTVMAALDKLGIDDADFVGNSLGGGVALQIALDYPSRVGRLVLLAPAAVPLGGLGPLLRAQGGHFSAVYRTLLTRPVFETVLKRLAYAQPIIDAEFMRWAWAPLISGETFVAASQISRGLARDMQRLHDALPTVFKRTLVVWGDRDGILDARFATQIAARMPRARAHIFRECAHCPMEEHPGAFNALLSTFLRE